MALRLYGLFKRPEIGERICEIHRFRWLNCLRECKALYPRKTFSLCWSWYAFKYLLFGASRVS